MSDLDAFYGEPLDHDIAHEGTAGETSNGVVAALENFGIPRGASVLEPGVGTGRVAARVSAAGYDVCGFDVDARYVEYARSTEWGRSIEKEREARLEVADLRDCSRVFEGRSFAAAFCPVNSLAHLVDPGAVVSAIRNVLERLESGAPFLVGLTVMDADAPREITEDIWSGERGGRRVTQQMQYIPLDREIVEIGAPLEQFIVTEIVSDNGEERVRTNSSLLAEYPFAAIERLCAAIPARIERAFDLHGAPVAEPSLPGYRQFAFVLDDHSSG